MGPISTVPLIISVTIGQRFAATTKEDAMFLVSDNLEARQLKIRSLLANDPVIALIFAAVDFEWTVQRAILGLGKTPTMQLRKRILKHCSGLRKYQECWKREVSARLQKGLEDVVPDWKLLNDHYALRHELVHGRSGTTSTKYAKPRVETMLAASRAIAMFAAAQNAPVYGKAIRRTKPRD